MSDRRCVQLTWPDGNEIAEKRAKAISVQLEEAGVEALMEPGAEVGRADLLVVVHSPVMPGDPLDLLRRTCADARVGLCFVEATEPEFHLDDLLRSLLVAPTALGGLDAALLVVINDCYSVEELQQLFRSGGARFHKVALGLKQGAISMPAAVENLSVCLEKEGLWAGAFLLLAADRARKRHLFRALQMLWRYRPAAADAVAPTNEGILANYLDRFIEKYDEENRKGPFSGVYVSQPWVERTAASPSDYSRPEEEWQTEVQPLRRLIRFLQDPVSGGGQETAELAAASQRSRFVRDVIATLLRERHPVVLLAAPGMGKSTTMRSVAVEIARRERRRPRPRVPLFLRLGRYRSKVGPSQPGDVFDFVLASLDPSEAALREQLPALRAQGRLIYLLDGMDEMDQDGLYTARVEALSAFGSAEFDRGNRTLFACRINNFSPRFTHKQMVLLPFDEGNIRAYLRKNLLKDPTVIAGRRYTRLLPGRLLEDLYRHTPFLDTLGNPLVLFLICDFLRRKKAWPSGRRDLFDGWLQQVQDLAGRRSGLPARTPSERAKQQDAWARIAWELTTATTTVVVAAELRARLDSAGSAVDEGLEAGLLTRDPARPDVIEFEHHRFQEFLCARHLVFAQPVVDWASLLDAPAWREVLLHAVSLAGEDAGGVVRGALQEILRGIRRVKAEMSAAEERAVVQAVLLGARLWGAFSQEKQKIDDNFRTELRAEAEQLARVGRPTSQVRMLWACVECPDLPHTDILAAPLESPIPWVREQALVVMGRARRGLGQDLGLEMALDLAREGFWRRWSTYRRAIQAEGMEGWRGTFVLATGIAAARAAAMAALPVFLLVGLPRLAVESGPAGAPGWLVGLGDGWGLIPAVVIAAAIPWLSRITASSEARTFAVIVAVLVGLTLGIGGLWVEGLLIGLLNLVGGAILGLLGGLLVGHVVQLLSWLAGALALGRGLRANARPLAKAAWSHSAVGEDALGVGSIVGMALAGGVIWELYVSFSNWLGGLMLRQAGIGNFDQALEAGWGSAASAGARSASCVGAVVALLLVMVTAFATEETPKARVVFAVVGGPLSWLAVLALGALFGLLIHGWIAFGVGSWIGPLVVVLLVLAALGLALFFVGPLVIDAARHRYEAFTRSRPTPHASSRADRDFVAQILDLPPDQQISAIQRLSPKDTGGDPHKLQAQLDRLAEHIPPDHPAADALARKQDEIQRIVEQPGGASS